jgi:acyl carrier protein
VPELTEGLVVECVLEVLDSKRAKVRDVDASTPLESLQFDSLEVAELFATIEERSGLELDPDSAREMVSVGDLAQLRPA